ncbi:MAG: sugar phosphate isomerase/epimerase [Planctomycetia bacterium]|nr:sugar phosphate isomerase/epimerase [Planctomycetia bacterium]
MNRRSFMKTTLGTAALGLGTGSIMNWASAAEGKKIPIALELYSLRNTAPKDVPGTLKLVAEMGYEGVECAGYYGLPAQELRKMFDDFGLKAVSTHTGLGSLLGNEYAKTVEFNQILGNKYLIVPGGLVPAILANDSNQMAAHLFNELSIKAEKDGMFIGYHCHTAEFGKVVGMEEKTGWELFFERTRPEVVAQVDIGWCNHAGQNPAEMIRKFPGREKLVHVKADGVHGTVVGDPDDKVDWKAVIAACSEVGGTEWLIVEQEQFKVSEIDSARECLENLKKAGF